MGMKRIKPTAKSDFILENTIYGLSMKYLFHSIDQISICPHEIHHLNNNLFHFFLWAQRRQIHANERREERPKTVHSLVYATLWHVGAVVPPIVKCVMRAIMEAIRSSLLLVRIQHTHTRRQQTKVLQCTARSEQKKKSIFCDDSSENVQIKQCFGMETWILHAFGAIKCTKCRENRLEKS